MDGFKNILIPIDLTVNTQVAVKKALELADPDCTIHLLYVQSTALLLPYAYRLLVHGNNEVDARSPEEKLEEWKYTIEETVADIKVCTWISMKETVQDAIEQKAKSLHADLIIIGKNSHHSWFPFLNTVVPSKIALATEIPVLTVKPGSLYSKIKAIVIPVAGGNTESKIEAVSAICKKFSVRIYLVSFMNRNIPEDFYSTVLLAMYQRIRAFSHCPVEYAVLHGGNKAKAILKYAKRVNADMLLVHPDVETKIGWPSKYISDVLPADSKVQVLAV